MTKHERINRDLQRLKDTGKLWLHDPEVWGLRVYTLPNGRYEVSIDFDDGEEPYVVIASWSLVINEVTSFYTTLEEIERL
mgnify:CR=1 FL=1